MVRVPLARSDVELEPHEALERLVTGARQAVELADEFFKRKRVPFSIEEARRSVDEIERIVRKEMGLLA